MPVSGLMGLETALRGLLAEQRALDVTSHNIANANTVGYTRQQAVLTTTTPYTDAAAGQIGTGVDVSAYTRLRDTFVDTQYRAQNAQQGAANALQDGLSQVEDALAEPSANGLNALFGKYWAAWQDVSNAPDDVATRQALVQAAKSLTDGINGLASQLGTQTAQTQQDVSLTVQQVNVLAGQIADLNGQINAAETGGGTPNDLLDRRDQLLDQLSGLAQISVTPPAAGQPDGAIKIGIGVGVGGSSNVLVDGAATVGDLVVTQGAATNDYTIGPPGVGAPQVTFGSAGGSPYAGSLGGLQHVLDLIADPTAGYRAQLDAVAQQLAADTNAQHALGIDLYGNAGGAFFAAAGGGAVDAATITVAPALLADPRLVAAGASATGIGDGSNAVAIANLRTAQPPAMSAGDLYTGLVTTVGTDSQRATQDASIAATLVSSVDARRQSVSGVSLDEEMANLVRYQRGYQAAARAFTAMDQVIDELINRTGSAGL